MKRNMKSSSLHKEADGTSRRRFLADSGKVIAGSMLTGIALNRIYAAEDNIIRIALIGCGGRGSGAAVNALSSKNGPVQLYAMADIFEDRLNKSYNALNEKFSSQVNVPPDRRFIGFDAYRKAIDSLRPGDVLIQATHSAFRATHVEYAVEKGLNVFMEKSFAPDPGGTHRVLKIAEAAKKMNLKMACGLMCRHSSARQALIEKIRNGDMGDINLIRAYRMDPGAYMGPFDASQSELLWQIRRPYWFMWVSSGWFIDMMIHQVDECCWIKDAWPISAHGLGGVVPGSTDSSQNLHSYAIEYTFPDGAKAFVNSRAMSDCRNDFVTYVHGTKCAAQFSGNRHAPTLQMYEDQQIDKTKITWRPEKEKVSPYQVEWDVLLGAIREDRPHNEIERAAYANMASLMGRAAVHIGNLVTWDQMMASNFQFCPNVADLNYESPAPVRADANGRYQVPVPGQWTEF